ncbi:MAG: glutamine--fructose-6-phosphate transaminase (isomerizing) [Clostridia bacterium]|nr:glutamine--fructose-6-phosphate transaminase (isomerizing) [Clostridia bacterium]
MCGIVGYIGNKQAGPILLEGLHKLEYRGYDSAGIAVYDDKTGKTEIVKAKGRLKSLMDKTNDGKALIGTCGIGHTRWATHGEPSETNAHPHCSDDGVVIAVHNGIIENYAELKAKLLKKGYSFYSQTDTEVATKLIRYYYEKYNNDPIVALERFIFRTRGSYAIAVMFKDYPDEIYATRKDSPMIIGVSDGATYLASDVPAILKYTRNVYYIGDREIARLVAGGVEFFNVDKELIEKSSVEIKWDAEAAEKGGYEHFMMKEICEQPKVVADTVNSAVSKGRVDFTETGLTDDVLKKFEQIYIVGCGSAYHVGAVALYVIEKLAKMPTRVELASEFRYRTPLINEKTLVIVISQSGETADSLAALRESKEMGATTLAIVNVVGSSIARDADHVFYTKAGPEISVATTKAYSSQLIACYLIAIKLALIRGVIDKTREDQLIGELISLPDKIKSILEDENGVQQFATTVATKSDVFFIGRGIDYAVCLEGSLKLKEISYIHSEAYAAGELKHGTISLIEEGTLVAGVLTQDELFEKTVSNLVETKSRGAIILGITVKGKFGIEATSDFTVYIPETDPLFYASLVVIPLQLLAYYVSASKGLDVDKPRNLAKSVTVE